MATSNFVTMKYDMPLVVGNPDYLADEWDEDEICEMRQETERVLLEAAEESIAEFNKNLKFFEVSIKGGYYESFQFYVDENNYYYDGMDNDDAHYYYGMCRSKVIRAAEAEKQKIRKWLKSIANGKEFIIIEILARFSNGETWYTRVA